MYRVYYRLRENNYVGFHSAPTRESGSPLYDLTNTYPDDIYSYKAVQYYGTGSPYDGLTINIIQSAKNKPNKQIKIYRSVPDVNREITKQIKDLNYIVNYKIRYGFFPMRNKIIDEIEKAIPWEKGTYDERQEEILNEIYNRIEKLEKTKEKPLKLNPGDWVTLTKQYAVEHGRATLNNKFKIVSKTVPAKSLFTVGDSIHEWGYNPT